MNRAGKEVVVIDRSLLQEAKRLGFHLKLEALAARPEIAKRGVSASSLLDALKSASGNVVRAKHALCNVR